MDNKKKFICILFLINVLVSCTSGFFINEYLNNNLLNQIDAESKIISTLPKEYFHKLSDSTISDNFNSISKEIKAHNEVRYINKASIPYLYLVLIIFSALIFIDILFFVALYFYNKKINKSSENMEKLKNLFNDFYNELPSPNNDADVLENITIDDTKLNLILKKLEKTEKIRHKFTANVSHELKTPLTSINGYAELIANGIAKDSDAMNFAKIIHSEGERLLQLINDTIKISSLEEENPVNVKKTNFDLYALLENVCKTVIPYANKNSVSISLSGKSTDIHANERMITDLIHNLIGNSIKYNKRNGSVSVSLFEDATNVFLRVVDTGIGISEKDQKHIFERFYVASKARSRKHGTGLGLSLVKHIVILHNGQVNLNSTLNKGTEVTVTLPK